ncbi:hypothetical protein VitviT2T_015361 [Vitis vinifera]|uniref:BHLH domain-containing protein n=3 Tax=Mesangiospermae TaxID=1437183 RepID=A0ABY9CMI9_VITVI|nr:hypothetical protein VitviT2T_015361 [Vitis vinifera]
MYIAVTLKRYRAVKEVGKIKMSVGIIAHYQLMQVCQAEYFRQLLKPVTYSLFSYGNTISVLFSFLVSLGSFTQLKTNCHHPQLKIKKLPTQNCKSIFSDNCLFKRTTNAEGPAVLPRKVFPPGAKDLGPFHGVEFQPSDVCPKNFIIFDQTDHRSQIMFHPAIAQKFNCPSLNLCATYIHNNLEKREINIDEGEASSALKEDSEDIDALLSLEEEDQEEYDEEEVSTARTHGNYGSNCEDTCSSYGSKPRKIKLSSSILKSSSSGSSCNSERKRQKMKKMVKALRGIVPGSSQMNTVAVLDEAVRYLKSLKVEVQKLGVSNSKKIS